MKDLILLIYPIGLLLLLNFGAKVYREDNYNEECFSLMQGKYLQAVASIGIIFHHLVQKLTNYGEVYRGPITIFNSMGILFTSIFFFFSGYGLILSYMNKSDYLDGFLKKRFSKILLPFFILNIVYLFWNGIPMNRVNNIYQGLTSLFGFTLINTNAWFIVEIVILYICFYFCFKRTDDTNLAIKKMTVVTLIIIIASMLLGHDYSQLNGHWFMGEWWYNTTILFSVGLFVGKNRDRFIEKINSRYKFYLVGSILLFIITFIIEELVRINIGYYAETYTSNGYPQKAVTLVSQMLTCVVFIMMILIINIRVEFNNKLLRAIAPLSLEIYLVQDLFIISYSKESVMPAWMIFIIVLLECIGTAVLLFLAERKIIEICDEYKKSKMDESVTFEKRMELKQIDKWINIAKVVVAVMAISLIVLFFKDMYDKTIGRNNMIKNEIADISVADVGDIVKYGHFDIETYTRGDEEIEWIVIKKEDNKSLLLSKNVLFGSYYNQLHKECRYEDSDLRKTLIGDGYYGVFYSGERAHMVSEEGINDPVFLLSKEDALECFENSEERLAKATPIAEWTGVHINPRNEKSWWWLRGEKLSIKAPVVSDFGDVIDEKEYVNVASGGVRPAIWVSY